ncbi:DUF1254 domain-containing protein [Gordonia sp. NB41Y]|uniref:DUF1254 domain-containing protein n=1 Tax=Gordonia sp. NB41Y TaxID=875808 RepID=UPI0002BEF2FD|nr:DUF1254 domain-containing protein [Gordonia sp. NB41Y]EMP14249.1 membrane protein [Gordonia sp. NB41Y]WLP89921.1 DUF1254 domain-containing protein [Gordonia sp. NB41Y]
MSTLSDDLQTLAHEAYVYLYPLVTMDVTRRVTCATPAGARPAFGPPNTFHHIRAFPTADFRAVVRPNFDTLYSSAWLDLTAGPVRIHVPDSGDRYFMLPMLDMWTDVFANPGKRTTGTGAQDYLVVPPGWDGEVPDGAELVTSPTPYAWIIGRTQTNGPHDYAAVNAFQDGLSVTEIGGARDVSVDSDLGPDTEPLGYVNAMKAVDFFGYATRLLAVNPPHATDFSQLARLGRLGIGVGRDFDASVFADAELEQLQAGADAALQSLRTAPGLLARPANGWGMLTGGMGVYGNFYLLRAMVTLVGLGANPPEDAIYPLLLVDADGDQPVGETDYVLHFDADALPPVSAFWSVTMYDADGFQVANELDRFALGDRDPLVYHDDGSLDIYIQRTNPGGRREANWLPAATGELGITLRLYAPHAAALDGRWQPPALVKS